MRLRRRRLNDDKGSMVIETVILAPTFMLFVALIFMAGRVTIAQQSVEAAANDAARSASIERSHGQAQESATSSASSTLSNQDLNCSSTNVSVDTAGFSAEVGTAAHVTATVRCEVPLSDLALPGVPGSRSVEATVRSPIDTYRER